MYMYMYIPKKVDSTHVSYECYCIHIIKKNVKNGQRIKLSVYTKCEEKKTLLIDKGR